MNKAFSLMGIVVALCVTISLAQDQPGRGQDRPAAGQQGQGIDDQMFIREAISGNQFEIQLSELINQRAQDQQIKQFAQKMIEEHRQAQDQLKPVAQAVGVSFSEQLNPVHQAKLQAYQQKQGRVLELGYIFDQVGMHHKDLLLYQFVAQTAQNPQLRQFASQQVPTLRQHLQMAERIAPGGLEARPAGERVGPGD